MIITTHSSEYDGNEINGNNINKMKGTLNNNYMKKSRHENSHTDFNINALPRSTIGL